jgi:hypothetical protein
MGPQNCCDGKHSDVMMHDFRALLDNAQDVAHCLAIHIGRGRLSSITVVLRCIYRMNNSMQWSSIFTMLSTLKLRV